MARTKSYRQSKKMTLPVTVVAGFLPGFIRAWDDSGKGSNISQGFKSLVFMYTGYNMATNKFDVYGLKYGLLPVVLGFAIHKVAGVLGVNRMLTRARVPFIRV